METKQILLEIFGESHPSTELWARRLRGLHNDVRRGNRSNLLHRIALMSGGPRLQIGPVHIIAPCSLDIVSVLMHASDRDLLVEDCVPLRTFLIRLGDKRLLRSLVPLKQVLRNAARPENDRMLLVTFPDTRCLNFETAIRARFINKKRLFGLEDTLTLTSGTTIGILVPTESGVDVEWWPRSVGPFDGNATELAERFAVRIEEFYRTAPDRMLAWAATRTYCTDIVESRRSREGRITEALLMHGLKVGCDPDPVSEALQSLRKQIGVA